MSNEADKILQQFRDQFESNMPVADPNDKNQVIIKAAILLGFDSQEHHDDEKKAAEYIANFGDMGGVGTRSYNEYAITMLMSNQDDSQKANAFVEIAAQLLGYDISYDPEGDECGPRETEQAWYRIENHHRIRIMKRSSDEELIQTIVNRYSTVTNAEEQVKAQFDINDEWDILVERYSEGYVTRIIAEARKAAGHNLFDKKE